MTYSIVFSVYVFRNLARLASYRRSLQRGISRPEKPVADKYIWYLAIFATVYCALQAGIIVLALKLNFKGGEEPEVSRSKTLLGTLDFTLLAVDGIMTLICIALIFIDVRERQKRRERQLNHSSADSGTRTEQAGRGLYPNLLYGLFCAMVVINVGRSVFRTVAVFSFDLEFIQRMASANRSRWFVIAHSCFLLFNSLQNLMIFTTIVVI